MYYDVVEAKYENNFRIKLLFADGSEGIADLKSIISKGGVFLELQDLNKFKEFFIHDELKVLTWANEIDIAPETLYTLAIGEKVSV